MIPFLHLGPLTIPTFGLMVATGLLGRSLPLAGDFDRRREQFMNSGYLKNGGKPSHHDEGFLIIGVAGLAGLVGQNSITPSKNPPTWQAELFSPLRICLVRRISWRIYSPAVSGEAFKIPLLNSWPMFAGGGGWLRHRANRLLLSGDGDYGRPTSWPWPWGMAFPMASFHNRNLRPMGWPADCRVYPLPFMNFSFGYHRRVPVAHGEESSRWRGPW